MNTEQVVAMIDAITEGKKYTTDWETAQDGLEDDLRIEVSGNSFNLIGLDRRFVHVIRDPRAAREIAGALVAWANRKEGDPLSRTIQRRTVQAIVGDAWNEEVNTTNADKYGTIDGEPMVSLRHGESREDWYRRNVGRMSQETKDRNLHDLKAMLSGTSGKAEDDDIRAAIRILRDNGAKDYV